MYVGLSQKASNILGALNSTEHKVVKGTGTSVGVDYIGVVSTFDGEDRTKLKTMFMALIEAEDANEPT